MSTRLKKLTIQEWVILFIALSLLIVGIWFRQSPRFAGVLGSGHDETLYSGFLGQLTLHGSYPQLVSDYIQNEASIPEKRVSPMRSLYLLHAWLWQQFSSSPPFETLKDVSAFASILTLVISALFARRLGGNRSALALLALMAVAPLQIFNAHRALIDGYFAFWAIALIWTLWECLERPKEQLPLVLHTISWIPLVLTKETAVFLWTGVLLALAFSRTSSGSRPGWRLWFSVFLGPSLGAGLLIILCGGPTPFLQMLDMALHKQLAPYTMFHADGPWYGYLLAIVILSPTISVLALAAMFGPALLSRAGRLMTLLVLGALIPLSFFPYQIVPRLLTLCDFPLRWLCWIQILWLSERFSPRYQKIFQVSLVLILCYTDFQQFYLFFQKSGVYEPTNDILLKVLKVVK